MTIGWFWPQLAVFTWETIGPVSWNMAVSRVATFYRHYVIWLVLELYFFDINTVAETIFNKKAMC